MPGTVPHCEAVLCPACCFLVPYKTSEHSLDNLEGRIDNGKSTVQKSQHGPGIIPGAAAGLYEGHQSGNLDGVVCGDRTAGRTDRLFRTGQDRYRGTRPGCGAGGKSDGFS